MRIVGLWRFPVKSMAGTPLGEAELGELGIAGDRSHVVVDAATGAFLSLRCTPKMALLEPTWSPDGLRLGEVFVPADAAGAQRDCDVWGRSVPGIDCGDDVAAAISDALERPARLLRLDYGKAEYTGFADAYPLLVLSMASLRDLSERLGEPVDPRRFRANILVDGCAPYAEDGWSEALVGNIKLTFVKPCARCVATTVDSDTGVAGKEPLRTMATYRRDPAGKVMFGVNAAHDGSGVVRPGDVLDVR